MRVRPAPTTTVATALVVAIATLPLRDVFGDWGWAISVVGAALCASLVASVIETLRPRLQVPVLCAITVVGAAAWGLCVSLRDVFWSAPTSSDAWTDLADGFSQGWGALLDEQFPLTDPQSAETFAAALVWIASAAAVHVASRRRTALAAIAAGAVVLAVTTAASLPRGLPPVVYGGGAGILALLAIATVTRAPDQGWRMARIVAIMSLIGVAGVIATIVAIASTGIDRTPVDPRSARQTETVEIAVPDVLSQYGDRRLGERSVLALESDAPIGGVRLRLQVYDSHDGERWLPSAAFTEIATFPGPEELPPGDLVSLRVRIDELDGPWIPLPDRLISIDLPDVLWNDEAQTMITDEQPVEYEFTGTLISRADLEGMESARDEVPDRLRDAPPGLPASIRDAAVAATADAPDAVGAIDAIAERLRALGRDETTVPGNSFGRLRDDLASGEATGAEQIASLHALMLRAVDIPSRVVVGYVANGPLVESDDLHVWVEVAFPGVGWVAFDPVPAAIESGTETLEDPTSPPTTQPSEAPLQARALPRELGPGEDPGEAEIDLDEPFTRADAAVLVLVGIGGLIAMLVGTRMIRRRVRRRSSWRAEVRVLGAWAELVDRLRELGAPITSTTTTGDIVYMSREIDETLGVHAEEIAGLAAQALHGPRGSLPDEAAEAWEHLRLAEARITAVKGRLSLPRRYLDPRVLRYRAPKPPPSRHGGRRSAVRPPPRER